MKKREKKQKIKKPKDPRPFAQRHPKWNTIFCTYNSNFTWDW